jgi:hypothetical protein
MVKVLSAAPERWSKIYCLSRRPPPDYFYDGLGEGATRVEHVEADFLTKPEQIAEKMKEKIKKVSVVRNTTFPLIIPSALTTTGLAY